MGPNTFALSRTETDALKGIAIIAMLLHHLYCSIPSWIEPYNGFFFEIGAFGKVCVSIFLFCSGYGLSVQYKTNSDIKGTIRFLLKRLFSFYINYWIIFLLFVPVTILFFGRSLSDVYGNDSIFLQLVIDILGFKGERSYNITWWFNELILILYFLFPFLYLFAKKSCLALLACSFMLCRFWMSIVGYDLSANLDLYQLSFVAGIVYFVVLDKNRYNKWLLKIGNLRHRGVLLAFLSVLLLSICVVIRSFQIIPHWSGARVDVFVTIALVLVVKNILNYLRCVMKLFGFIGKHSSNIYLIHTFFNIYWGFYWLHTVPIMRNGLNFIVLLAISLSASIIIEWIKTKTGVYKLLNTVKNKLS